MRETCCNQTEGAPMPKGPRHRWNRCLHCGKLNGKRSYRASSDCKPGRLKHSWSVCSQCGITWKEFYTGVKMTVKGPVLLKTSACPLTWKN